MLQKNYLNNKMSLNLLFSQQQPFWHENEHTADWYDAFLTATTKICSNLFHVCTKVFAWAFKSKTTVAWMGLFNFTLFLSFKYLISHVTFDALPYPVSLPHPRRCYILVHHLLHLVLLASVLHQDLYHDAHTTEHLMSPQIFWPQETQPTKSKGKLHDALAVY